MAPFAIEGATRVYIVVLPSRGGSPLIMRFRGGFGMCVAGCGGATGRFRRVGGAAPRARGSGSVQLVIVAVLAILLPRRIGYVTGREVGQVIQRIMLNRIVTVGANPFQIGMPDGV